MSAKNGKRSPRGYDHVLVPSVPMWFVGYDAPPSPLVRLALIDVTQSRGGCEVVHGHHIAGGSMSAYHCCVVPFGSCIL